MERTIDVIIPVYKPDRRLRDLILRLCSQKVRPRYILLVNTEKELFDAHLLDDLPGEKADSWPRILVQHIRKLEFDHGGTRHMAAGLLDGEMILFMTQDAVPEDIYLTEALLAPFADPDVCAAYARQLPRADAALAEQYTRNFNYPPQSRIKSEKDLETLGIKTFFCSNVCAMYRRSAYEENGGFERHTIFNEDMIFAAKLIYAGKKVAYCAEAKVIHSHNYSGICQFHRNFDLGVSQAEHPEVFSGISSESEGVHLIQKTASYLMRKGKPWLLLPLIWQSGCKYAGYLLGKNYARLPGKLVRLCSMNKAYWEH
ncbi:MAG: glycosyltransferase family 2 protein [Lachnospiraceae bacterium]|nr:glycosyltransferase family 2 protein [Lachnospiraceae bacterium]